MSTIYEDVEMLKEQMMAVQAALTDTDWINLPLADGITVYDANSMPQYRKIGNVVYLRGGVKNITANNTIIGTLPEGFRPVYAHPVVQNTSKHNGLANVYRLSININGTVEMIVTSRSHDTECWYPINTHFVTD